MGILALVFFLLARDKYPIIAYVSFGVFVTLALMVGIRYIIKGPEAERGQAAVYFGEGRIAIVNVEPGAMQSQAFREFIAFVVAHRRPLPAPAGIMTGPSSDPASIREIPPEEAEKLRQQDNAEILPSGTSERPSLGPTQ